MVDHTRSLLPILCGPTGSGKSALALMVARELGLEVISADSRQLYSGLQVATAAPSVEEQEGVVHHLVGTHQVGDAVSAGEFSREVGKLLARFPASAGPDYIMVGGSFFYIHAFCSPVDPRIGGRRELRESVTAQLDTLGAEDFRRQLIKLDPEAAWIDVRDTAKMRRYMEICLSTDLPATMAMRELKISCPARTPIYILNPPLAELTPGLKKRLKQMLRGGMVQEVTAQLEAGCDPNCHALQSVGVEEIREYLAGRINREKLEEQIYRKTRRYAKKQLTWARKLLIEERAQAIPNVSREEQANWLCHEIRKQQQ